MKTPTTVLAGGTVKAGAYLITSMGDLMAYRTSQSGATEYPFPDRDEAAELAAYLGYELIEIPEDMIGD